jgi:hypothetical protein
LNEYSRFLINKDITTEVLRRYPAACEIGLDRDEAIGLVWVRKSGKGERAFINHFSWHDGVLGQLHAEAAINATSDYNYVTLTKTQHK